MSKPTTMSDSARIEAQIWRAEKAVQDRAVERAKAGARERKARQARQAAIKRERVVEAAAKRVARKARLEARRAADRRRSGERARRKQAEGRRRRLAAASKRRQEAKRMPHRVISEDRDGGKWLFRQLKPFGGRPYVAPAEVQHVQASEEIAVRHAGRRPDWVEQMSMLIARHDWVDIAMHCDINRHSVEELRSLEIADHIAEVAPVLIATVQDGTCESIEDIEWQQEGCATLTGVGGSSRPLDAVTRRINGVDLLEKRICGLINNLAR